MFFVTVTDTTRACTTTQRTWTSHTRPTWVQTRSWCTRRKQPRYGNSCGYGHVMDRTLIQPFLSHLTQSLAEVATLVARSLYMQAGGKEDNLNNITADPKIVSHMTTHTLSHDHMWLALFNWTNSYSLFQEWLCLLRIFPKNYCIKWMKTRKVNIKIALDR